MKICGQTRDALKQVQNNPNGTKNFSASYRQADQVAYLLEVEHFPKTPKRHAIEHRGKKDMYEHDTKHISIKNENKIEREREREREREI